MEHLEHYLKVVERSGQIITAIATGVGMSAIAGAAVMHLKMKIAENAASKPAPSGATKNS